MKKVLFGVLAAGVLAFNAPVALANHQDWTGGCFFDTNSQETATNGAYVGVIGATAAVQNPDGTPATGSIKCKIQVNGSDATGTFTYTGTGVVAGANQISFNAADDASVTLCQDTGHGWECEPSTSAQIPPQEVIDLLIEIDNTILGIEQLLDELILCQVLAILFPPTGDVTLPDPIGPVWDCPPYSV